MARDYTQTGTHRYGGYIMAPVSHSATSVSGKALHFMLTGHKLCRHRCESRARTLARTETLAQVFTLLTEGGRE